MPGSHPSVTILLAVYNEADSIDECLASLQTQDYPGPLSAVVADGRSTDGTTDRLKEWQRRWPALSVIDNDQRRQSVGLNLAARRAEGEILVRTDAHTFYAPDYVRRSVETLLGSTAVAVGGTMHPRGTTPFGRAVAAAMRSPFTTGPGKFHYFTERTDADTVYLGTFRRRDFLDLGGFRRFPAEVAEDADLYFRWRNAGHTVLLDPAIRSVYRPRQTPLALLRQHFRYGQGKAEMLYANRSLPSWRPLAPLFLVLGLGTSGFLAVFSPWQWPLLVVLAAWLAVIAVVAVPRGRSALRVVAAASVMHIGYGIGVVWGLVRGPGFVKRMASSDLSAQEP